MLDKDVLKILGRRIGATLPVGPSLPLPSDLTRLVRELEDRRRSDESRVVPESRIRKAA